MKLNVYQEITIINGYDSEYFKTLSQLFLQLHLAFVEQKDQNDKTLFGISLPQLNSTRIGYKIRVFAPTSDDLTSLNLSFWLKEMQDYVHCTSTKDVPMESISNYATYSRFKYKSKEEKILHQAKRRGISVEESRKYFEDYVDYSMPYIHLRSLSLKINFQLYIKKTEYQQPYFDGFSTYGLSPESTVPEF